MRIYSKAFISCLILALPVVFGRPAAAKTLLTQKEALNIAFPAGATVERRTAYLTEEQRRLAQKAGRVKIDARVWTYYVGASSAGVRGYAYFDTHLVRTMPETLMVVLDSDGEIRFVEILSFIEPEDYLPRGRWLEQFPGRTLNTELMVRRGIRNISGASLTSQALTDGVRRVLAVHGLLQDGNRIIDAPP